MGPRELGGRVGIPIDSSTGLVPYADRTPGRTASWHTTLAPGFLRYLRTLPAALRWGAAFLGPLIAVLIERATWPFFAPTPYMPFYAAIALVAWWAGMAAGFLAIVLSALLTLYFITPPFDSF